MSAYKIIAKNKAATQQWELPFESATLERNLNNVHTASINVSYAYLSDYLGRQNTTPKDLFENAWINIYIYKDNNLIFGGFLCDVVYNKSSGSFTVQLGCKSWLAYFENRLYSGIITATDAGMIAWNALNSVNDIGITQGTITATKTRDRTYKYDDVCKIVVNLGSLQIQEGFEFDLSNLKVFTVVSRIGSDKPTIIFDDFNVIDYSLSVGLVGKLFNYGTVLGSGMDDNQLARTYDAGSAYQTNWYKQEALLQETDIPETVTLDDDIKKYVELRKNPIRTLTLKATVASPIFENYDVGDGVVINLPDISMAATKRIVKKTLTFGGTEENVNLEFLP